MVTDEIITDGSVESGRRYSFRAFRCYRFLKLDKSATEKDIERAYIKEKEIVSQDDLPDLEFAYEFALEFRKLFETLSVEAKKDWGVFFDAYNLFIEEKTEDERLRFEESSEEFQLSLLDMDVTLHPLKYAKLRKADSEIDLEGIGKFLTFALFFVFGIPILILAWNLHPVLGILGIIAFVWLVRNRLESGYFFG